MNAEQIRAAIAAAMSSHDAEGMTMQELRDALGHRPTEAGLRTTREKVRQMIAEGLMVHAGHRSSVRMDGVPSRTPVYRLVAS